MQLIVTCAGCGAKYRGESGPKKFRCAACSNLFTFPEQPKAATAGTILCSNCWTETVPTEKLKTCGFCSQRVSPRYGGVAAEDKQVKVKQPSVRNDPNLVKAVTRNGPPSGEVPVGGPTTDPTVSQQFGSNEWKEIGVEQKTESPDPTKTQAFELMAELKKEIEPEMQSMVESIMKSQSGIVKLQPRNESQILPRPTPPPSKTIEIGAAEASRKLSGEAPRSGVFEARSTTGQHTREKLPGETGSFEARGSSAVARSGSFEKPPRESAVQPADDAVRDLHAKVAELTAMLVTDKRAKEQLLRERAQFEGMWRDSDAKVAELNARLNSDSTAYATLTAERDDLREFKRQHEGGHTDLETRLNSERQNNESLQREREQLTEARKNLEAHVADMSQRIAVNQVSTDHAEARQELEVRVSDLESRLSFERKSKEALIKERDEVSDSHRESLARIADLESRLHSEREAKSLVQQKHDQHLEAKNELDAKVADLESRLNSEREAKDSAAAERAKLLEVRKELEARTADLARRHANERDAKERVQKEHADLSTQHHELSARVADFSTRLKAEQDIKESVRRERDAALTRADNSELRIEKSEAETARLRKSIGAQVEKFAAEYNGILGTLAQRTAELGAHSAATRKRLEEAAQHHGATVETGAAELKAKLEHESVELGQKLKKLMQEHEGRESARLKAQSGGHPVLPSSSQPARLSGLAPIVPSSTFVTPAPEPEPASGSEMIAVTPQPIMPPVAEAGEEASNLNSEQPIEELQVSANGSNASSSSRMPVETDNLPGTDVALDKSSGTFWAKVFKRPSAKT